MDEERTCVLLELNNMQMRISTLFQDLMIENNNFKQNSENLTKQLEKLSHEVVNLKNEVENLKKQKEALKQNNGEMIDIIDEGIRVFKTMNLSNVNLQSQHKTALDSLKKIFLELSKRLKHSKMTESVHKVNCVIENEIVDNSRKRYKFSDTEAQKELESLSNFSTDFYHNEDDQKSPKIDCVLVNNSSDTVRETFFQNTYEVINGLKGPSSGLVNETCDSELVNTIVSAKIFRAVPPSPEEKNHVNRSPVFKDVGVRRHDGLSNIENNNKSSTSLKLINEKFLERPSGFIASPWKKSPHRTNEKSPLKLKRVRKKLKISSPDGSQFSMLKTSNTREAEVSLSGVRKFRQAILNIDWYKKNSSEENLEYKENENCKNENDTNQNKDKKLIDDFEDDDLIIESPQKASHLLEDVKNENEIKHELNEEPFITPPKISDFDLDETYISSSFVQKCNLTKKRECEEVVKNQTPLKRPALEKSTEYDSVPFVYKREPIRKKTERMKLPGHACAECYQYYEKAFGDIETEDLKKMLNKCSRHRDKNSPSLDDTPLGYWKPYLTCSTLLSPSKNEASKSSYLFKTN